MAYPVQMYAALVDGAGTTPVPQMFVAVVDPSGNYVSGSMPPQGRLTLTTATPVLTATVSAAGTVYYTPYQGNIVPIYNGTYFVATTFTELSNVLANSATGNAGPAAAANNSNYDLFVWNNAGTLTLTRGPLWTSDTARGTGAGTTELVMVSGILLNANAITNGPAAQRGTYVGTIRTNGTATTDWNVGGTASGGTAALLNVWNCYNRVTLGGRLSDSDAKHAYSSNTIRAIANSATYRVSMIRGLNEDLVDATLFTLIESPATLAAFFNVGFGLDATNAITFVSQFTSQAAAVGKVTLINRYTQYPGLGFHFLSGNEQGDATNSFNVGGSGFNSLGYSVRA